MWIDWSDFLLQVAPSNPKSDWILTELVDSTEMVPDAYPDHRKSPQWRPSKCLRTGEHGGVLAGLGPNSGVKMPKRWKIRYGWAMRHPWVNLCYVFDWTIWGWDFDSYPNDVLIPDDTVLVCFFLVGFPETTWDMSWLWLIPSGWRWRSHVTTNHYLYGLTKYIKHEYTDIIRHIDNYI